MPATQEDQTTSTVHQLQAAIHNALEEMNDGSDGTNSSYWIGGTAGNMIDRLAELRQTDRDRVLVDALMTLFTLTTVQREGWSILLEDPSGEIQTKFNTDGKS